MLIVTHGGKFHADDAWAVAVLQALHPEADLIRTRDQAIIDTADFVVDVGGVWPPAASTTTRRAFRARARMACPTPAPVWCGATTARAACG
jgi:hypothetical protein